MFDWWDNIFGGNGSSGGASSESGGASGNAGESNETDWGGLVDDVGGLLDGLFGGDFWNWIEDLGCLSSNFKRKDLKSRFPDCVNKMRALSGVDTAMSEHNVNEFSKRLHHAQAVMAHVRDDVGGCRHKYFELYHDLYRDYINGFNTLMSSSGFVSSGIQTATNFSQSDVQPYDGYDIQKTINYPTFKYNQILDPDPYDYNYIGQTDSGAPTLAGFGVFNWAIGLSLGYMGYQYARDNGMLRSLGIKKQNKRWK